MKNLKIGTILYITFGWVLFELLVIAMLGYIMLNNSEKTGIVLYENYGKAQGEIESAYADLQNVKVQLRNILYLYADDIDTQANEKEKLNTTVENMNQKFDSVRDKLLEDDAKELLEQTVDYAKLYLADVDTCLQCVEDGKLEEARTHLRANGIDSANKVDGSLTELTDLLDKYASDKEDYMTDNNKQGNNLVIGLVIIAILGVFEAVHLVNKYVRNPIYYITAMAQKVAMGELDQEIEMDGRKNEVGKLLHSFHTMMETLKEQASVLGNLSKGILDVEIKPHSEKDIMGNALKKLIEDDNHVFSSIRNATGQISLGTGQIAAASQNLAQGSTQQASAIEQITASITDIASKTQNNASQAAQVNQIVMQTKECVQAGNQRMDEMVAAMKEINESSEDIQKIIKVIDDIAFNTNILALNANVEAARAGEQGKGFAVVAEEVRNLAGRSAEASGQTAEMIEDSIEKVRKGAKLAQETAEALQLVSEMVENITELSADIANASKEQASATAQINQALMQVSQVVQTNSATSQQCASASEELSGQARGLEKELSKFQLKDVIGTMSSQTLEYEQPMMLGNISGKY